MFFSALHIILDFGVGLFDLHGTLSLTLSLIHISEPTRPY